MYKSEDTGLEMFTCEELSSMLGLDGEIVKRGARKLISKGLPERHYLICNSGSTVKVRGKQVNSLIISLSKIAALMLINEIHPADVLLASERKRINEITRLSELLVK